MSPRAVPVRQCTEARRPSPCCSATWMAAHAHVADASKRAPLIDAICGRRQCWLRSQRSPLTSRVATRDPRRLSQSTTCAADGGAYLQLCRVFARAELQEGASAIVPGQLATPSRGWRNHQRPAACLAIYGPSMQQWLACHFLL